MLDFPTYSQLTGLYADYAAALDNGEWDRWPEFFMEECVYKLQPRENFDRGFPLATMSLESKGMLKDRVFGVRETLFHDPYYQRHVVGAPRVLGDDGSLIRAEANYAVFRTKQSKLSEVFNTGRYVDVVQRTPQGLRFASRICVFDSEMIPNSIIYPI
ncbi:MULTISPECIES: aromatic-ring-hydroxylating dioxygenase subunit beta [Cupriavidus]|uniref:Salicylate 5-hydroxylase small subunit n=2 Tax=Cupriavidus TaxID=106589 RepID=A0A316F174_9BURK|nr:MULTISPECIES: aromatic-ring-hydroxylating dioxygenase subunit beta [Cupriavidus]PWK37319.1 salicylate 5-hydroxylase small subunit [Cupriavidus plantarum]QET01675.1 salicylate hydroxylase [Cupriavidus pauculus]RLK45212.1 salicylate 5-hydroxylase small subunit [Cupriavidus plantarum]